MNNKELLYIIDLAKKNNVNDNTLRRILLLVQKNGLISTKKVRQIENLLSKDGLNDAELLTILEKSYNQKSFNWLDILELTKHPQIKDYLLTNEISQAQLYIIISNLKFLPNNKEIDDLYLTKLNAIVAMTNKDTQIIELEFFHQIFIAALPTNLKWSNWYFAHFLNINKPLDERKIAFRLLKINLFDKNNPNIQLMDIELLASKIVEAYELYGYKFANLYATIITCFSFIDLPVITDEYEYDLYIKIYSIMCLIDEHNMHNFINSLYYQIATDESIPSSIRLEFISLVYEKNLVLKDKIIRVLWESFNNNSLEYVTILKAALLNNGLRTNSCYRQFFASKHSYETLVLAREVFRINRFKKTSCFRNINILEEEQLVAQLQALKDQYVADYVNDHQDNKSSQTEKIAAITENYEAFMLGEISSERFQELLKKTIKEEIEIRRVRKDASKY